MTSLLIFCFMLFVVFSTVPVDSMTSTTYATYSAITASDKSIFGATIATLNWNTVSELESGALGQEDTINSFPMWLSSAYHMYSASEILVVVAALKLVNAGVLPSVTATIPPSLLPRAVNNFYNPSFPNIGITLAMLMQHTSSLNDANFQSYVVNAPPRSVSDFVTFCESYYIAFSNNVYTTSNTIWSSQRPGDSSSYSFAHANIALLGYIINAAVLARPTLVKGPTKDVASYIQEEVLNVVGMSNTFLLTRDGGFPTISLPDGGPLYTNVPIVDLNSEGSATNYNQIHPAFMANYMYYTTTEDYGRLIQSLFLSANGALASIGKMMRSSMIQVSNPRRGQFSQGFGVIGYSPSVLCTLGIAMGCTGTPDVWGYYAVGERNAAAFMCTDVSGSLKCAVGHLSYRESVQRVPDAMLQFVSTTVSTRTGNPPAERGRTETAKKEEGDLLGLWVTLGVAFAILFVLAAAYFTEYIVQPVPLAAGVAVAPPPIPASYGQTIASPVPQFYVE